jgi:hypothetical protein
MRRTAAAVVLVCVAVYARSLEHFFVSDDFLNFERNGFRTIADALRLFSTRDIDFYRPIPRLHFGLLQGLFGDRVVVWNAIGVLLHAATSVTAAFLAASLLGRGRRTVAALTGLFFAVHFIHVEPVVWASGVTSVYVTLFLLLALLLFRRARITGRSRDRTLSVAAFAAALLSKETAVAFVPLLLLTTAWRPPRTAGGRATRALPTAGEALPYAILLGAWAAVELGVDRGGDASPYRMALGPHVVKNAAFFVLGNFLPLRYWRLQELWAASGGLGGFLGALLDHPGLLLALAGGAAAVGWGIVRGSGEARAGFAWIGASSLPFLLLPGSGERFLYLASFGGCLVLGVAGEAMLRRAGPRGGPKWAARAGVAAAGGILLLGNLDRQADWVTAGRWTRNIVLRWGFLRNLDPDEPIKFLRVPDAHRSAWVFRNGFDSMVRLYWEGRPYGREGAEFPEGTTPRHMVVFLHPGGTVGMVPEEALRGP